MTEDNILSHLDNSNDGYYCSFIELGHVYSYLIDARLNIFNSDNCWAIAAERLGFNPRAGGIILEISYFGNCLQNLESCNGRITNSYSVYPIDSTNFSDTVDGEMLSPTAQFWLIRGRQIPVSHNRLNYAQIGIELSDANDIRAEEAGRLIAAQNPDLFRATDDELYKCIPSSLKKILVLDEWFHKDFQLRQLPTISDEQLKQTYELNKKLAGVGEMSFESFAQLFRAHEKSSNDCNSNIWNDNRPSVYETWQQIAKVIVNNDIEMYKPTLQPNTHWKHWPDSGSL